MLRRRVPTSSVRPPEPGEMVTVRAHAGSRAAEEPRALVVDGVERSIEEICWRASVAQGGRRLRVFVVRVEGIRARLRLAYDEDDGFWTVEAHLTG